MGERGEKERGIQWEMKCGERQLDMFTEKRFCGVWGRGRGWGGNERGEKNCVGELGARGWGDTEGRGRWE